MEWTKQHMNEKTFIVMLKQHFQADFSTKLYLSMLIEMTVSTF